MKLAQKDEVDPASLLKAKMSKTISNSEARTLRLLELGMGATSIEADCPYLLNWSDDPQLRGCLQYQIQPYGTTIGSGNADTVRVEGLGVIEKMCSVFAGKNS